MLPFEQINQFWRSGSIYDHYVPFMDGPNVFFDLWTYPIGRHRNDCFQGKSHLIICRLHRESATMIVVRYSCIFKLVTDSWLLPAGKKNRFWFFEMRFDLNYWNGIKEIKNLPSPSKNVRQTIVTCFLISGSTRSLFSWANTLLRIGRIQKGAFLGIWSKIMLWIKIGMREPSA